MIKKIVNESLGTELIYEQMPGAVKGSVIVCAGGGYFWLSDREEWPVARFYAAAGYQTYILKYSTNATADMPVLGTKPLRQLVWAMEQVRAQAAGSFVAVCGFSAGGHLCTSLGVHWNDSNLFAPEIQHLIRPDAMVLAYPATQVYAYEGTEFGNALYRDNKDIEAYMNTVDFVSDATPPAFIWHTITDETVPVQMTVDFVQKLIEHHVMAELHLFPCGPHGLSMATPDVDDPEKFRFADPHVAEWAKLSVQWLELVKAKN